MTVRAPIFLENDTTNQTANILRMFVRDLFNDRTGVVNSADLIVTQRGAGANMSVDVGAGSTVNAGTEGSTPGSYVVHNDATVNVVITASNPTNPRNDLIITKVRDSFYSGASNDAQIIAVAGTPAGSPVDPDLDALGHENYQKLARVVVAANATSITNANIADLRTQARSVGGVTPTASLAAFTNPKAFDLVWSTAEDGLYIRNSANTGWARISERTDIGWTAYTPTIGNLNGAPASVRGRYKRIGGGSSVTGATVVVEAGFTVAVGGGPNGTISVSLPTNARFVGSFEWLFGARAFDVSLNQNWAGVGAVVSATPGVVLSFATGGSIGWNATVPFTWAENDGMTMFGVYEEA